MEDAWLEAAYEDKQNGGADVDELKRCYADELDPEDFCPNCGVELDEAGDGYAGLCAECADFFEQQKLEA